MREGGRERGEGRKRREGGREGEGRKRRKEEKGGREGEEGGSITKRDSHSRRERVLLRETQTAAS